jgi:hypothetical protein
MTGNPFLQALVLAEKRLAKMPTAINDQDEDEVDTDTEKLRGLPLACFNSQGLY